MRLIIIFYLSISFIFSFVADFTNSPIGGSFSEDLNAAQTSIRSQAATVADAPEEGTEWLNSIIGVTSNFFRTLVAMVTFTFQLEGAPEAVNAFVAGILGIISILFWSYVIKEVAPLVPGLG